MYASLTGGDEDHAQQAVESVFYKMGEVDNVVLREVTIHASDEPEVHQLKLVKLELKEEWDYMAGFWRRYNSGVLYMYEHMLNSRSAWQRQEVVEEDHALVKDIWERAENLRNDQVRCAARNASKLVSH